MFNRPLVAIVLCTGLIFTSAAPPSLAQNAADQPTAAELYQQGMEKFNAGDLEAARVLFRRVDPMQLPRNERVKMYEAMQQLDAPTAAASPAEASEAAAESPAPAETAESTQPPAEASEPTPAPPPAPPTPEELLNQADANVGASPSTAASLYREVAEHPQATDQQKAVANARLAQVQRDANQEVTDARKLIDEAVADLHAGKLQDAQLKLEAVQTRGTELGWFDQERLDKTLAAVNNQLETLAKQAGAAEAAVVERESAEAEREGFKPDPQTDPTAESMIGVEPQLSGETFGQMEPSVPDSDLLAKVRAAAMQKALLEAEQASLSGQHDLAVHKLEQASRLSPDDEEVKNKLAAAKAARDTAAAPRGPLTLQRQRDDIQSQAAKARYDQQMNLAKQMAGQRNYAAAIDAAAQAKVVLDQNQQVLQPEEYRKLRADAENLLAQILEDKQLADAQQQVEIEQQRITQQEADRKQAEIEQQAEVNDLLRRAMALRREMKYDEALTLIEQALYLDQNNLAAQALKEMILDVRNFVEADRLFRQRGLHMQEQGLQMIEATTPYKDLITYPADWPQLSQRRIAGLDETGGESEANRRVALKLRDPVPINFEANRFLNVIDYLRNTTGVNFFVNWTALEAAGVDQNAPITLQLTNVPADQALELVLQQVGNEFDPVSFSIIEGIVRISTARDLQKTTDIRNYDIRDLLVQVPNFTDAPEFDLQDALSNTNSGGGGGGGGGGGDGLFGDDDDDEDDQDQPTRAELIEQITTLIQDTVGTQEEWAVYGGDVSSIRELNGQLIVKSTPENHRAIRDLLTGLRETRAVQISVESRFLIVDENFLEEVGIDLDFQINNLGGNFGPIQVAQDSISLAQRVTGALTPSRFQLDSDQVSNFQPGTLQPGDGTTGPGFVPRTGRSLNLGVSYIDDLEVNLLIQATQMNQRSISLTAPRVTFFNGQRAYVLVVRQIAFISDLEPIPDAIGFDITISVVQSGVVLDVEGTISADRRYVTLTLRPSLARVEEPIATFPIGGTIIDPDTGEIIESDAFIQLPELELTSVRATVSVPDRGTLLLGGQRLVSEVEIEAGVPVLSKIPILNRLFTNNSVVKDERTLLILVRPTIIIQSEEEELLFPGLLQDIDSYNTGQTF